MKNFDSHCLTSQENTDNAIFGAVYNKCDHLFNKDYKEFIKELAKFRLSEARVYLYGQFNETKAYSIVEDIQVYKITNN